MKKLFVFLAAAALTLSCTTAPAPTIPDNLAGTWSGIIEDLGLALTLHLGDTCTVDSPDQGAFGLKAEVKEISEDSVDVKFPEFRLDLPLHVLRYPVSADVVGVLTELVEPVG